MAVADLGRPGSEKGRARTKPHNARPPGPAGGWLTGNLKDFEADRLAFLCRLGEHRSNLVSFDARTTFVNDHELADAVLRDPTGSFEVTENFLMKQVPQSELKAMLDQRRFISPGLRRRATAPLIAAIRIETNATLDLLCSSSRPGGDEITIDGLQLAETVIARVVGKYFFGEDYAGVGIGVRRLLDALEVVIGNVFALPRAWRTTATRRIDRAYRDLHIEIRQLLQRRMIAPGVDGDLAATIVRAPGAGVSNLDNLSDTIIGALLAAQRVPAAAAAWTMLLVAQHAGTQDTLRREARRFAADLESGALRPIATYQLTLATVLESLRLYPPTWLLTRTTMRHVELGGYMFAPGHVLMVSPYVMHRDDNAFPSALSFAPQRWLSSAPPTQVYLPFGRGRHRCPGSDLATTCLVGLLLTLLDRYQLTQRGAVHPDARASLRPAGLQLSLSPPAVGGRR